MDDGWTAFFSLLGIVSTLFVIIIYRGYFKAESVSSAGNSILVYFIGLIKLVPIGLFLVGPIADTINGKQAISSIPTIATFITMIILKLISVFMGGPEFAQNLSSDNSNGAWCTLPGLEFFENPFFPSSFLASTIIGFYYLFWSLKIDKQQMFIGSILGIAILSSFIQFTFGGCAPYYKTFFGYGGIETALLSIILGVIVAGITFASSTVGGMQNNPFYGLTNNLTLSNLGPGIDPNSGTIPQPSQNAGFAYGSCPPGFLVLDEANCIQCSSAFAQVMNGQCISTDPRYTPPDPPVIKPKSGTRQYNQSGGTQEGEQTFVAELYKNGQIVTESIGV